MELRMATLPSTLVRGLYVRILSRHPAAISYSFTLNYVAHEGLGLEDGIYRDLALAPVLAEWKACIRQGYTEQC